MLAGRMLILAHTFLGPSGLLFLAVRPLMHSLVVWLNWTMQLPLPCVENSRYMSFERLASLMSAIGFEEAEKRVGGKMAYWLYRKTVLAGAVDVDGFRKKCVCRQGQRNNFCILFD